MGGYKSQSIISTSFAKPGGKCEEKTSRDQSGSRDVSRKMKHAGGVGGVGRQKGSLCEVVSSKGTLSSARHVPLQQPRAGGCGHVSAEGRSRWGDPVTISTGSGFGLLRH